MTAQQKLEAVVKKNNSLLCVGLDSELAKLPVQFDNDPTPQFSFNKTIIEATHDLVCAFKPNSAFYEARGAAGITELKQTCDYICEKYPEIFIIIDAKRGDIGNTNNGYVKFIFDYLGADAVTLHPYLGREAAEPFLKRADKAAIILCRTSNPGAGEFQNLEIKGEPLYKTVAKKVVDEWNSNNNCMLAVGATYPEELAAVRALAPEMTFLAPGLGAQGGDVEKAVRAGLNKQKTGLILNSSRGIIFTPNRPDFAEQARAEAMKLRNAINQLRNQRQA